jgi:hypothetical protein
MATRKLKSMPCKENRDHNHAPHFPPIFPSPTKPSKQSTRKKGERDWSILGVCVVIPRESRKIKGAEKKTNNMIYSPLPINKDLLPAHFHETKVNWIQRWEVDMITTKRGGKMLAGRFCTQKKSRPILRSGLTRIRVSGRKSANSG